MKKITLSILFFNLVVLGWSQNLRLAVPVFTPKNGFSQDEAEVLTDLFTSYLVEAGGFEVLTRTEIDKLLSEMQFQASGLTSDTDYARVGAALNAKAIITGNLMKLGSKGYFTVSIIEVETFKVLSSSRTPFDDLSEIVDKMPSLAKALIKQINSPNLLIGTWTGTASSWGSMSITFHDDGTFSMPSYRRRIKSYKQGSRSWEYSTIDQTYSGELNGTYTYTKNDFILNWSFSGSWTAVQEGDKGKILDRASKAHTEQGSNSVNYTLSADRQELKLSAIPLFRVFNPEVIDRPMDNWSPIYITSFKKVK
jgi:hypothetical protein